MILKLFPLVPHDTKIDFFGHRFYAFCASLIIIGGSILCLTIKGLNFGIDFTGGTIIEISVQADPDLSALRSDLNGLKLGEVTIQEFGSKHDLMIRLPQQEGGPEAQKAAIAQVRADVDKTFGEGKVDYKRVEFVGPQVGQELKKDGLMAVLTAIGGIMAYIWFRFKWQYGIGALLALIHDVVGILGLFSLTQMPFDLSTLSAILLVAGYSINETVIIFDRVRETLRKYKKTPMQEIINYSINSTLPRTIMTSGSTLLALLALWLFGGLVIRSFVSALFLGILIGTHSSYFVSSPSLYYLKLRPGEDTEPEAVNGSAPA
ncbi:MAG TPA: protein translocase subunit SecF [Patescibacteria group bacterium]|nr:protein translocase subunit SecF [Patescibacteria group bacterium]